MKALWKGYVTLGQLGIPIRLYAATKPSGIKFVQLHEADSSPVERPLFCRREHKEIPSDEIVRGVEVEPGKYVMFTERELMRTRPEAQKAIEIRQFSAPTEITPYYYEKPYYMAPVKGGEVGYALLREALERTKKYAIGRFYFYGNEYVTAIAAYQDVLMLYRLRFADEIVPRTDISTLALPRANPAHIDMMESIIERYSVPLHLRDYHNEQAEYVQLLRERKAKGLAMPRPERVPADTTIEADIPRVLTQIVGQSGGLLEANNTTESTE